MHPGIGPSSSEAAGPETSGSRYHLGVALGEGGFGSVYLAELEGQQGFRKRVALKILHGAADARKSTLRRFRDEARLLGLLEHHAIVGVHGLVELDGQWAVVMEYLPGVDLEFVVEHGGALGCGVAARVGLSAAGALDFAWRSAHPSTQEALGLEHRDIKPANLLMTRAGALKVLDFGIARARFAQREAKTLRQGAMGTPPYMPPERWLGRGGHESDVFSLATTVLFLATGRGLPEASSIDGYVTWRAAMMADLRGLEGGEVLAEVLAPALVDDPAGRPTAADMRVSLRAVTKQLGGETLEEWADERLPPMIAAREAEMGPGPLTGKVLTEGASTDGAEAESLPSGTWMPEMDDEPAGADGATSATLAPATVEPPRAEERASSPLRAWVVGAASLGGLALVVLWAATRLAAPPLLPPTVEPLGVLEVEAPVEVAADGVDDPVPEPAVEPVVEVRKTVVKAAPTPAARRAAKRAAKTATPAPPPVEPPVEPVAEPVVEPVVAAASVPVVAAAPEPAPAARGRVRWEGDAKAVRLRCGGAVTEVPAASVRRVAAGSCTVQATWQEGGSWADAGKAVDVPAGGTVSLKCAAWNRSCTVIH